MKTYAGSCRLEWAGFKCLPSILTFSTPSVVYYVFLNFLLLNWNHWNCMAQSLENSTLSFLGIGEDSKKLASFKQTVSIARSGILPPAAWLPTRQPGSLQGRLPRDGRDCLPSRLWDEALDLAPVPQGRCVLGRPPQSYPREPFPAGTCWCGSACAHSCCHCTAFLERELCCASVPAHSPSGLQGASGNAPMWKHLV